MNTGFCLSQYQCDVAEGVKKRSNQPLPLIGLVKVWEYSIQEAIEKQFPDSSWWEIYPGQIFEKLYATVFGCWDEEFAHVANDIGNELVALYDKDVAKKG